MSDGYSTPLPASLSQALVAFVIEFDNEFEHRMPHRTSRHGSAGDLARPPWLVSMAMWEHCMRFVPPDGIPAGELARRSRLTGKSMQGVLKRMSQWWGYLKIGPDPADTRGKPPRAAWLVRPTSAGRQAQEVWEPLTEEIEERWRSRFGEAEIGRLRAALQGITSQFDVAMPAFLPLGEPRLGQRASADGASTDDNSQDVALPALMSKVLLAFGLGFDSESGLSLSQYTEGADARLEISANILRVLGEPGARTADLPELTGVAKMSIDNWLGALERYGYLNIGPDPAGSRFKHASLTRKGLAAREVYDRWAGGIVPRWEERFGATAMRALQEAAAPLQDEALLLEGAKPYPDGWRAQVKAPSTLPHYPVISMRGGFPDGS